MRCGFVSHFFCIFDLMKKYGLIGFPLGHSASAKYFGEKFDNQKIDAQYELYPIESIECVKELIEELDGFNVTIPYKRAIIPYLTTISDEAKSVGAVNCVKIDSDGCLHGYNTDVVGIRATLAPYNLHSKKALVLGTGGAAAAVVYVLESLGMEVLCVSRKSGDGVVTYAQLSREVIASCALIVNATPVGMYPNVDVAPQLPYDALDEGHILFDLVYNPELTLFLKKGLERGATVLSGVKMFVSQAEASWDIWNK